MEITDTVAQEQTTPIPPEVPQGKIGRLRASYLLMAESFELLKKDKEVMLFTSFSILANILVCTVFIGFALAIWFFAKDATWFKDLGDNEALANSIGAGVVFLLYICIYFITTFFEAGIVTIVHARINGRDLTFKDGLQNARQHAGKLLAWTLVAATIGIILQYIAERSKLLGRLIAYFFGALWGIITFFMVPTLVLEEAGIGESIKRSGATFKNTWGETLIINFSTGIFFGILILLAFIIFLLSFLSNNVYVIVPVGIVCGLFALGAIIVSATLNSIFRVVLYEYAKYRKMSDDFTPELILGAVKKQEPRL